MSEGLMIYDRSYIELQEHSLKHLCAALGLESSVYEAAIGEAHRMNLELPNITYAEALSDVRDDVLRGVTAWRPL